MKAQSILAIILMTCWLGALPAVAHDCCHHDHNCAYANDYNHDCDYDAQGNHHRCAWAPTRGATELRTSEGKITEIDYLPGTTPDSAMVEVRLESGGQNELVRLAPVGFLKQSGMLLREGDAITVKGFPVSGMEGELLIVTELHKGEKSLSLRDPRGRPVW